MKHSLQLRQSQHLTLTPQLQQSIRLLQLSTLELNQELERVLQENPLIERDDDAPDRPPGEPEFRGDAPAEQTQEPEGTTAADAADAEAADFGALEDAPAPAMRDDDEENEFSQVVAESPTLRAHLLTQLSLTKLPDRDRQLVALLIDSLDEDGYLTMGLPEVLAMLPPELGVELEELQIALKHLQHFEPAGVGAHGLGECLALQLAALPEDTQYRSQALQTVTSHLDLLAARDFVRLKRQLRCDDVCLRAVQKLITGLDPRPARSFAEAQTRYIVPDVMVRKVKNTWVASLNPQAMPRLRINRLYADILSRNRGAGAHQLASQLQEARWLIRNIQQRFDTILRVAQAIADRQRQFLEHGEVAMRPLVLREIAAAVDLHESTISRVTTQKYMHTPRGIFELKYFFGSHVTTETGGAASSTAIRALIRQLVSAEDTRKPLTDSQIAEVLGQQGIVVARRTVAKYRESLQILPVNLRRTL
jgi:RNA polymerase sigma-54 factor